MTDFSETEFSGESPRVGVVSSDPEVSERIRAAGAEVVEIPATDFYGEWGIALVREWVSDRMEIEVPSLGLDALAFDSETPEELAGVVIAAIRLGVPAVCLSSLDTPLAVAVAALGFSPLGDDESAAEVAARLARDGEPDAGSLADNFALANALRAGLTVGGGPELMVHLAAVAKEAGVVGFDQMLRVLAPETVSRTSVFSEWFEENGFPGVLALLGDDLHDVRTVSSETLKSYARPAGDEPSEDRMKLTFVKARTSGAEAVCFAPDSRTAVEGSCRVFDSESDAVEAVYDGDLGGVGVVVVRGCGPRGAPGLWRLDELAHAIEESEVGNLCVLTDGVAPEEAPGVWLSLFSPEAASRGVVGRLEDGDFLRFDLEDGRILTSVGSRDFARRTRMKVEPPQSPAYAARYAKAAESALNGATFR